MNNQRGFLANAVIYGLGGIAMQMASVILLPLYTHYLSPAEYGVLEILERTGQIVALLLLGNGIRMATFSFYCQAKTPLDRQRTFSAIAVVLWSILAFGMLAGCLLAPYLANWLEIDSPLLVVLGIAVVLLQGVVALPLALMQARVESFRYVVASFSIAVARMALVIAAVVWLGMGVWGVLAASAICFSVFGLALSTREVMKGFVKPDRSVAINILRFALPLLPSGIFALLLTTADRYFLLSFGSSADVGTYSLAYKLAALIPALAVTPLWKVWTAKLYDVYILPDAPRAVGCMLWRLMVVRLFIVLGVCLFSAELVALVAPADYISAATLIPILAVASTLEFASTLSEGSFWSMRQTRWKPIIMAVSATTAGALLFILVPKYGGLGAALSIAAAYAVQASVTFLVTQRVFHVAYDWRAIGIGVGTAVGLYFIGRSIDGGVLGALLKFGLWASWPVLLWNFRALSDQDKEWTRRFVRRGRTAVHKILPARSMP